METRIENEDEEEEQERKLTLVEFNTITSVDRRVIARFGHSGLIHKQRFFIFGGRTVSGYDNEMYYYDLELKQWVVAQVRGTKPPRRIFHSMVLDEERELIYIYGGRKQSGQKLNDLFEFDIKAFQWKLINVEKSPPSTDGHSAVFCKDIRSMIVFGGFDSHSYSNRFYRFDFKELAWNEMESLGDIPSARAYHTAQYCKQYQKMILFGGKMKGNVISNETFIYDIRQHIWIKLDYQSNYYSEIPRPVYCTCSSMITDDIMIIIGGEPLSDSSQFLILDCSKLVWHKPILRAKIPCISRSVLGFDKTDFSIVIYGGYSNSNMGNELYQAKFEEADEFVYEPIVKDVLNNVPFFEIQNIETINNQYFDLIIETPSRMFATHKLFVSQCKLLDVGWLDYRKIVSIDVNPDLFEKILSFIYGSEPVVTFEENIQMLEFAINFSNKFLYRWSITKLLPLTSDLIDLLEKICNQVPKEFEDFQTVLKYSHKKSSWYFVEHLRGIWDDIESGRYEPNFAISTSDNSCTLRCDKVLLIARSQFFRTMLTSGFLESFESSSVSVLEQLPSESFKSLKLLVEHLYGRRIEENLSSGEMATLHHLSNFYIFPHLENETMRIIYGN